MTKRARSLLKEEENSVNQNKKRKIKDFFKVQTKREPESDDLAREVSSHVEDFDSPTREPIREFKRETSVEYLLIVPADISEETVLPMTVKKEIESPDSPESKTIELKKDLSQDNLELRKKPKQHKKETHDKTANSAQQNTVACKICKKLYLKWRLKQHMLDIHDQRKPFSCDLCGVKTTIKNNIQKHMGCHYRPYTCETCGKTFSEKRYFREHRLNHEDPNPFKCKLCSSAYTRKTSLTRHMHTAHSDERQFPCSQFKCKYSGKTQADLTSHKMSHTKAYKCDRCPRKFSRLTLLNQHRVLHDNPNAYQCEDCKQAFNQKKQLKAHKTKKIHICERRQIELGLIVSDSEEH